MNKVKKDVVIIGAGPAGLSAAVYAGRAKLDAIVLEKGFEGGQILNTEEVDNYLGVLEITGPQLSMNMYEHAKKFGIKPKIDEVIELDLKSTPMIIKTHSIEYEAKTVVLAMGATPKQIGAKNENMFRGKGVSYCAICDGGFFLGKTVAVVGGGDKAIEDAIYLSRMAKKVYLIHRRDALRATKILQEQLMRTSVEIIWEHHIVEIRGEKTVSEVILQHIPTGQERHLDVDGIFVAVGSEPATDLVKGIVPMDKQGYIFAGENCATDIPGVFAAGDIRVKPLRQILTAAADGAVSIYEVEKYILEN
ncbi:MAG: thioredoxin-disulfide reductase [Cellulosilyticaceae bacterium]